MPVPGGLSISVEDWPINSLDESLINTVRAPAPTGHLFDQQFGGTPFLGNDPRGGRREFQCTAGLARTPRPFGQNRANTGDKLGQMVRISVA
jgi:hypothetical protein